MANPSITMSEETEKFKEAVNKYFSDNGSYPYQQEKGYLLLLLLYLIKNNGLKLINSTKLTNAELSKLKVLFCYPFKNLNGREISEELEDLYLCDCCVINLPNKEKEILEIAEELGINLKYDSRKNYGDINFVSTLFELISISPVWYKENSSWAFEQICREISPIKEDLYILSKEVRTLLIKLLDAKYGNIYYPYANRDIVEYINANAISKENSYIQTINTQTDFLIRFALLYNDISIHHIKYNSDSHRDRNFDCTQFDYNGFDYILAIPPRSIKSTNSEYETAELDHLARSSEHVKHKSVGVYPSSICFSRHSKKIVKKLLENDWIEKVILLPENLSSYAGTETVIIVVNKDKSRKGEVCFVDATKCFIRDKYLNILDIDKVFDKLTIEDGDVNWVSSHEILDKDESIYPKYHTIFKKNIHKEGDSVVKLSDILVPVSPIQHSDKFGRLIRGKDLNDTLLDCLSASNKYADTNGLFGKLKVEEPVILLSEGAYPTYYVASPDAPLFVSESIRIYKIVKEWVSPEYLCYELAKTIDTIKIELPRVLFAKENLLCFKIIFPSQNIEDQKRIVEEAIYQQKISQAKELGLQAVIERMKTDYMNEVRMRRHDMRPYLSELRAFESLMQSYIEQLDVTPELRSKFSSLVVAHMNAVESLSNLVSVLTDEQTFGEAEDVDINKFFKDLVISNDPKVSGYKVVYQTDNNALYESAILNEEDSNNNIPLYVNIAKIDLERLVTNILVNARTHGFAGREDNNGVVKIFLTINSETDSFQIDFINNGNPLPKGMNKMRFGLRGEKAGITGGTGNGGYIVKSTVGHYKGDYDIFMDGEYTVIRVLLPISSKNYE